MTNISAMEALRAAVSASNTVTKQSDSHVDFSSYLKTNKNLEEIYKEASQTYGVAEELLKAMTKQESNFNPNATSRSGAQGLMQLMPATAVSLGVTDAYDPYQNIMGGAKYIRQMLDKYNGNVTLALAAYNAGSGNVDKYGGVPPFEETQNYIAKITKYLEEGVSVPDTETVYATPNTINGNEDVTYADLNTLAGEILTEIFSYDDYMQYLNTLLAKEETAMELSLAVTSTTTEEEEQEEFLSDSYIAYQNMSTTPAAEAIAIADEITHIDISTADDVNKEV